MMKKHLKKVVIAGTNHVAYDLVFAHTIQPVAEQMFLLESDEIDEKRIADMIYASSAINQVEVAVKTYKETKDADILVISATPERLEDESETDHLKKTIQMVRKIINQSMENGFNGIVIIATQPTEIFTHLVWKFSGLPKHRVIGLGTYAESLYFQQLLSAYFHISIHDVHGYLMGASGIDEKVPIWSRTSVGGVPVLSYATNEVHEFDQKVMSDILEDVLELSQLSKTANTGYSTASALLSLLQAIGSNAETVIPISYVHSWEELEDITLSVPAVVSSEGVRPFPEFTVSDIEKQELLTIATAIKEKLTLILKGKL
ncbi:lactate/malate family dehydrogenase [Isobaculum melis]|nr:lactate dehydrogenase [Isobaculum melis]